MNLDALYQEIILDHYRDPHGRDLAPAFAAEVYHVNPTCGDEITLRIGGEMNTEISYLAQGCSISQASTSMMFELLDGHSYSEGEPIMNAFTDMMHDSHAEGEIQENLLGDAIAFRGVAKFPARIKCALLAWMAWKGAMIRTTRQDQI